MVSIAGLLALFLVKNEEARKVIFYLMSIWGVALLRLCGPTRSRPTGWDSGFSRWDSRALCIAAMAVHFRASAGKGRLAAYLLLTVSLAGEHPLARLLEGRWICRAADLVSGPQVYYNVVRRRRRTGKRGAGPEGEKNMRIKHVKSIRGRPDLFRR